MQVIGLLFIVCEMEECRLFSRSPRSKGEGRLILSEIIQSMVSLAEVDWKVEPELAGLLFEQFERQLCAFDVALTGRRFVASDFVEGQALRFSQLKVVLQQKLLFYDGDAIEISK